MSKEYLVHSHKAVREPYALRRPVSPTAIRLRTVIVDGRHARVYAETREVDSCRTPDNPAGLGPWAISFSITGRFEGGRPDALTASIQGPFIHDSGVFVTEPL